MGYGDITPVTHEARRLPTPFARSRSRFLASWSSRTKDCEGRALLKLPAGCSEARALWHRHIPPYLSLSLSPSLAATVPYETQKHPLHPPIAAESLRALTHCICLP
jgi:hypothetical protein